MSQHHILLLTFPAQGHINPNLQLAKILVRHGIKVTFATTVNGLRQLLTLPAIDGLYYASFSDGDDEGTNKGQRSFDTLMNDLNREVAKSLKKLVQSLADNGRPVNFILYGFLLPMVAAVARELHIPSGFAAFQCATAFAIHHKFFSFRDGIEHNNHSDEIGPSFALKLPGLPLFSCNEIPTFLVTGNVFHSSVSPIFRAHIKALEQDPKPCVLVNTFDALEEEVINSIENIDVIAIGPLIPSAFSDGIDQNDRSFGGDLFKTTKDYLHFLDSKPKGSIVYISFGSLVVLKEEQKEEILESLLEIRRPFLWVLRSPTPDDKTKLDRDDEDDEAKIESRVGSDQGMVVPWCSQMEVLCHESIGCFFTHCGWNSTLEGLVAGVPMLGCPQLADQVTNAKMVEEVWGTGLRGKANEEGVVERGEIKRCLEILMDGGERGEEIRRNTVKWRALALEAVKEGGSSNKNLKAFLEKLG